MSGEDEIRLRDQYHKIVEKIVPNCSWDRNARADARRLLANEMRTVEKLFTFDEMDYFLNGYNAWNCGMAEDLNYGSTTFLEKASRLNTARSLALMLLLMEKQYPLDPEPKPAVEEGGSF